MVVLAFLVPVLAGHSNVHFAILHRLLSLPISEAPTQIHIIGDEPLRQRIMTLPASDYTRVAFHPLDSVDTLAPFISNSEQLRSPPFSPGPTGLRVLDRALIPVVFLSPDTFLRRFARTLSILQDVKPDLVVIDVLHGSVGSDACRKLDLRYVRVAPVSSLDMSRATQPGGRSFWKYPAPFSPTRYPVPLLSIPYNILCALAFIVFLVFHAARRGLDAARKEAGLSGSVLSSVGKGPEYTICPSLPELEYPHVPLPRTILAGPILTPVPELTVSDHPNLAAFLARGRTAVVNMGSLFQYTADDVTAMASGLRAAHAALQGRGGLQILWKLPGASGFAKLLDEQLEMKHGWQEWMCVQEWINPPMHAVLQHSNVIVSVHHGGANSVHEATYAGVPQVILPQWLDLYTNATRVEGLGHGIYGNRNAETKIDAMQLTSAIVSVCSDRPGEHGAQLKARADHLGRICRAAKGDERAAGVILAAARGESLKGQQL